MCDNVITLAPFPEMLPMVAKQAITRGTRMGENKQARNSAHGSSSMIPVRKGNGFYELWYTIPYHLLLIHTINITTVLYVHLKKKEKEKRRKKHEEELG